MGPLNCRPSQTLTFAPLGLSITPTEYNVYRARQVERINFESLVVFEDHRFLVIDKPFDLRIDGDDPGLPLTLERLMQRHRPQMPSPPKWVHQIDYATSGIITIAKTREAAKAGSSLFASRKTTKHYSALAYGHVTPDSFVVDAPIEDTDAQNMMRIGPNGRVAQTEVTVLARGLFLGKPATKLLLKPITGRRHQLRLHMTSRGHPIVGDLTYCQDYDAPRMMLHAATLVLPLKEGTLELRTQDPFGEYLTDVEIINTFPTATTPAVVTTSTSTTASASSSTMTTTTTTTTSTTTNNVTVATTTSLTATEKCE
jgi:23S rRNA-/tRNA-specific pseudouridylate synthase